MKGKLTLKFFAEQFRKQFLFQRVNGGRTYLTNYNHEAGLPHAEFAMMLFAALALENGFSNGEIMEELGVDYRKLKSLLSEWMDICSNPDRNKEVVRWLRTKSRLVRNAIRWGMRAQ